MGRRTWRGAALKGVFLAAFVSTGLAYMDFCALYVRVAYAVLFSVLTSSQI